MGDDQGEQTKHIKSWKRRKRRREALHKMWQAVKDRRAEAPQGIGGGEGGEDIASTCLHHPPPCLF